MYLFVLLTTPLLLTIKDKTTGRWVPETNYNSVLGLPETLIASSVMAAQ